MSSPRISSRVCFCALSWRRRIERGDESEELIKVHRLILAPFFVCLIFCATVTPSTLWPSPGLRKAFLQGSFCFVFVLVLVFVCLFFH